MEVLLQSFGGTKFCHKRCEQGLEKLTEELSALRPESRESSGVKIAS